VRVLPIVVVYLNNVCDSQCITCSIWRNNDLLRIPSLRQMPEAMIEDLGAALARWSPRQILLSGGEPVLHPQFAKAVARFGNVAPSVCVVTNGLLLSTCTESVLEKVREFYISFDAPDAAGYRKIRGVDGFDRLAGSMQVLNRLGRRPRAVARCTLQRENVRQIPQLIACARRFGFDAISFLPVDVSSTAFARDVHGAADASTIQPALDDLVVMERDIRSIDNADGFVEGGSEKLQRIHQYFRAVLGTADFPAVRCNAPWVSVVVETTGNIRGCFFQPVIGDYRSMNGNAAVDFRRHLDVDADPVCRRCVCSKMLGVRDFVKL
jgi:MoaA/NifB/PqqE/SkfB family radical SAM enzyme